MLFLLIDLLHLEQIFLCIYLLSFMRYLMRFINYLSLDEVAKSAMLLSIVLAPPQGFPFTHLVSRFGKGNAGLYKFYHSFGSICCIITLYFDVYMILFSHIPR